MSDRTIGAAILLLSIALYYETYTFRAPLFAGSLGPSFFPRILLIVLGGLSLILILFPRNRGPSGRTDVKSFVQKYRYVIFTFFSFGVYAFLMPILGYVLDTFLYLVVVQYVLQPRPLRAMAKPAFWSLAATYGLLYFFQNVLRVILPQGLLL